MQYRVTKTLSDFYLALFLFQSKLVIYSKSVRFILRELVVKCNSKFSFSMIDILYVMKIAFRNKYNFTFNEAQKLFFQIPDTMLKCAGLIETNEEEYDTCINMLFRFMIFGKATKSIDGQFLMDGNSSSLPCCIQN